ncbi:MAG: preprotein translocase subunit SecG [Rhodobacteraceae bacterium]|nr:MAG: preprotein translocase subunit SecG [Paracoccaceae bacterium]
MENIVLSIHLILTLALIGTVLLQRSEGGGLGMGGGGDGATAGRAAANAMTKLTWILAIGFLITSLTLTVIAAKNAGEGSVLDRLGLDGPAPTTILTPDLTDAILTPPSATDAPTAPPPAE